MSKSKKTTSTQTDAAALAASEKSRNAVIAEIDERLEGKAPPAEKPAKATKSAKPAKPTKPAKVAKAPKPTAEKKKSALDAAAQVLAGAKQPMRSQELIEQMAKRGLWTSPGGKTPHATLYAAMTREIKARGKDARFRKTERGLFVATGAKG